MNSNPFPTAASDPAELWSRLEARRPLPLRFALYLSRRPNSALCPCLQLDLTPSFTVTRILDPEHRVPYITLSPLFHSAGLTLAQGLLRFNLNPTAYDLSLAGLEPWDDIWTTLPVARSVATELGLADAMASILDAKTSLAWSLDEFDAGLAHNWRVPQQRVDSAGYSTDAITRVCFERLQMLPAGRQIKTLVSTELRSRIVKEAQERRATKAFRLHQRLVQWSAQLYAVSVDAKTMSGEGAAMLEDLNEVVLAPTQTDVLEWLGFVAPDGEDAGDLFDPPTLAQLAELRRTELPLGQQVQRGSADEAVAQLDSILRAKLALLHRINLVSLPHLASTADNVQLAPSHNSTGNTQPPSQPASRNDNELAQLHAKLDSLSAKLEDIMAAGLSTRTTVQRRAAAKSEGSVSGLGQILSVANLPLRRLEVSLSPVAVIISALLAFIVMKSTID